MRRTVTLPLLGLLTLALMPAAQAQAQPVIAPGVTAAGTDVGGLTLDAAAAKLYAADAALLGRPIRVQVAGRAYALGMRKTGLAFNVGKTARRAYNAGRKANGAPVDVPLYVTYDKEKVLGFAERVRRGVRIAPRDARVRITLRHISRTHSRAGRDLDAKGLATAIGQALVDPRVQRTLAPATTVAKPKVTANDLARVYGTVITIDRGRFTLRLFKSLKAVARYRVAVGQPSYPTPTGTFHVLEKQVNPVWSVPNSPWAGELAGTTVQGGTAANPLKARWMGLGGGVGIHGTGEDYSIGTRASHGCIRMHVSDVVALFARVPLGTTVVIGD